MRKLIALGICLGVGVAAANLGYAEVKKGSKKKQAAAAKTVATTPAPAKKSANGLVIADFDSGTQPNNVGGKYGAWDKDPNDATQSAKASEVEPGYDGKGKALKLTYDVDSPNPAYNGFWMKMEGQDASQYGKLTLYVKGDEKEGYTTKFKIELKNDTESAPYYVTNVSDNWEKIEIPVSEFTGITDWTKMTEFVIVFEDGQVTQKTGSIYVDQVAFEK